MRADGSDGPASEAQGNTIRVVAARTGLGMETLRAWERRYGFPLPERRAGSNRRLYSNEDIERLLAIQRAIARGYRVGDVIAKSIPELERLAPVAAVGVTTAAPPTTTTTVSSEELVRLLTSKRVSEIEAHLRIAAIALGPRRFVTEVAHPFAVAVGQSWVDGNLSVGDEHLATECLVTQLRRILASFQEIDARPLVLLATLPNEPHTLPLQMVAVYLVALDAKPRLLGASTPPRDLAESAQALGADVIGLTITSTSDRRQARADVQTLLALAPPHIPVWLGGNGASGLDVGDDRTHVVTSWEEIDRMVTLQRAR